MTRFVILGPPVGKGQPYDRLSKQQRAAHG